MSSAADNQGARRRAHAGSFGSAAAEYDRARPTYPGAAIDWLLPPGARRVVDLGAGTGQLTRLLAPLDVDVVAVEPSAEMRTVLCRTLPSNVRSLAGRAEQIPLQDNSADVVVVAQAWHWVDVELAVQEVARILTPGGQLGLVWNVRDERVAWVAALGEIMHQGSELEMNSDNPTVGTPFGPIERFEVEWTAYVDRGMVLDMVASRSYVITAPEAQRIATLDAVRELLDAHSQLKDSTLIAMPYVTRCSRTQLSK